MLINPNRQPIVNHELKPARKDLNGGNHSDLVSNFMRNMDSKSKTLPPPITLKLSDLDIIIEEASVWNKDFAKKVANISVLSKELIYGL